ncbi:PAS domain-containing protein [Streptomyces sp. F63]|uniref:PAS domain-containing protein n=1 Tax=Streptomyces sp. F63 TaxID=2824887 RepID=UPI001B36D03C|nr:PAS domain-containing protein [Streptomyces sp. F63]MBQ0987133.1 PAS domain-containing protein [Streptomyces sp. F63]
MGESIGFGAELADFRSRIAELQSARSLPPEQRGPALDTALFELQHVVDVLWPRFERLSAAPGHNGTVREDPELRLLRGLFQRLPLPVVLMDRATVVRRLNPAACELFSLRAGYATGRALTGALAHDTRAAFRSQAAAVARGEGSRSLLVRRLPGPGPAGGGRTALRATLTALRPPEERQPAVLAVFQPVTAGETEREPWPAPRRAAGRAGPAPFPASRRLPRPDLAEVSQQAELLDLVDDMAAELLTTPPGSPEELLSRAARLLHGRFADWVIADLAPPPDAGGGSGPLRRMVVLGPEPRPEPGAGPAGQDPADCPLVMDAVRDRVPALRVRPEDQEAFGRDASGAAVLVSARVTSLLCVPLCPPPCEEPARPHRGDTGAPASGALTLFRTGGRRAFGMAEAGAVHRMARHLSLALGRTPARGGTCAGRAASAPPGPPAPTAPAAPA